MQDCRLLFITLSLALLLALSASVLPVQPITIHTPGENSLVTSPIEINASIYPGEDGLVRLTLVDRKQNVLARQLISVDVTGDTAIEFSANLMFEIPLETSSTILTIATQDGLHRPLALRSIELSLASSGDDQIRVQFASEPWLTVIEPEPGAVVNEPALDIVGTVTPVNHNPIIFEVLNERGAALVSRQLAVDVPGTPQAFEVRLALPSFSEAQEMRLIIRQPTGFPGVDAILDSLPLTINP